jgi:hypothetical protein
MLLSLQTSYCPNKSEYHIKKDQEIYLSNIENTKKEQQLDSLDAKIIKELKISKYFNKCDRKEARRICKELGIETKWFYSAIKIESGGNRKAQNKNSKATGLIGFLPSTAKRLNTSVEEIQQMSNIEQFECIKKYIKVSTKGRKIKSKIDLYLAILYPSALGRPNSYVIAKKNTNACNWNKPLDVDKDSTLTVRDIRTFVSNI